MSSVFCTVCGKAIDSTDSFCPNCGKAQGQAAPKSTQEGFGTLHPSSNPFPTTPTPTQPRQIERKSTHWIVWFFAVLGGLLVCLFLLGMCAQILLPDEESAPTKTSEANPTDAATPPKAPEAEVTEQETVAESKQEWAGSWYYKEEKDPISGKLILTAQTPSENTVQFSFPYEGSQNGYLNLTTRPREGKSVALFIQKGQFLCAPDPCKLPVKFDDDPVSTYSAIESEDGDSSKVFIYNYDAFVAKMKKAKKVYIEAPFYKEGKRIFEFDVSGFKPERLQQK